MVCTWQPVLMILFIHDSRSTFVKFMRVSCSSSHVCTDCQKSLLPQRPLRALRMEEKMGRLGSCLRLLQLGQSIR